MTAVDVDIESRLAELSDSAFGAFCDDIAAMFDAAVVCERKDIRTKTIKDLQKSFKKLTAVHLVEATGQLDGTFHLMFDQGGLFVLSGVIVMLPEKRILEDVRRGSVTDAENLTDATREVGNLLVGSWDRVFREECQEHGHFLKTATVIGKPWENLDEVRLSADDDALVATYTMTVDSYPSFTCAAIFPKAVMEKGEGESEALSGSEDVSEAVEETPEAVEDIPGSGDFKDVSAATENAREPAQKQPDEPPTEISSASGIPEDLQSIVSTVVRDLADTDSADESPSCDDVISGGTEEDPIERMLTGTSSPAVDVNSGLAELLRIPAKDVMTTDVVWSEPDETVQDVIAKMQQNNTGYVLVGRNNVLEGLVSNSSILGAVSPYLRPMFAKWRRPEDDATLGIKVKWIMSRPVRAVSQDASLASMIESMRRYGGRCLPVVDGRGKVQGIVTVFDVLLRILGADKSFSWQGKPPQAPPLLI